MCCAVGKSRSVGEEAMCLDGSDASGTVHVYFSEVRHVFLLCVDM
jgi:hypothetical protein